MPNRVTQRRGSCLFPHPCSITQLMQISRAGFSSKIKGLGTWRAWKNHEVG